MLEPTNYETGYRQTDRQESRGISRFEEWTQTLLNTHAETERHTAT